MALELFPHLKLIPLQSGLIEIPCSGLIQPYLSNPGVRFYMEILTPGLAFYGTFVTSIAHINGENQDFCHG